MASPTDSEFDASAMSAQPEGQFDMDADMPDALPPFEDARSMDDGDDVHDSEASDRQSDDEDVDADADADEDEDDDMKDSDQDSDGDMEDQRDSAQESDRDMDDDKDSDQNSDHDQEDQKNSSNNDSDQEDGSHDSGEEEDSSPRSINHNAANSSKRRDKNPNADANISDGDESHDEDRSDAAEGSSDNDRGESDPITGLRRDSVASHKSPLPVAEPILFRENAKIQARVASSFDIAPSVALPYLTQCHALAFTGGPKWILTGGEDGFIRKYDFIASMAGKSPLTMAQRHNMVDSVTKAGVIVSYWENEQPLTRTQLMEQNPKIKPADFKTGSASYEPKVNTVYALAAHRHGNWCLSGLLSGGISLYSMRHSEGAIQHYFMHGTKHDSSRGHNSAVSLLVLNAEQDGFLSGSWDSTIRNWDLNSGKLVTTHAPSSGQISNIQYRPTGLRDLELDLSSPAPSSSSTSTSGAKTNDGDDDDEVDSLFGDSDDNNNDDGNESKPNPVKDQLAQSANTSHSYANGDVFMSTSIDGTVSIWDVRLQDPVLKLGVPAGVPPWCMSSTWSNDGDMIYVGRRNSTVEEISIRKPHDHSTGKGFYAPKIVKTLLFPKISGPVSAIATMPNSDFLLCGSNDNIRLYNLQLYDSDGTGPATAKKQATPFLIIPGHQGGILSVLHVDETGRFMVSASGNRGWKHASYTDSILIYEIDFKG